MQYPRVTSPELALRGRLENPGRSSNQPFVTLSYAQSIDGSIARERGAPTPISSQQSLQMTHRLRAAHEGILVGIGTVLADDPRLDVRLADGSDPHAVVLDSHLRIPVNSRVFKADRSVTVVTLPTTSPERRDELKERGVCVVEAPAIASGWVDLAWTLKHLSTVGIDSLMVEGGARIISSFLGHALADHVLLTISPQFLGGLPATSQFGAWGRMGEPRLENLSIDQVGGDIVIGGDVNYAGISGP